jgi:tRNA (cmo5U34)-methyltransferase
MTTYRWNTSDFAAGYDAVAEIIHPHYLAIQDAILDLLPASLDSGGLIIDLGGGSGRLVERILDRWPRARAVIIDQSEPFLALAERRLQCFGARAVCVLTRLQDDWSAHIPMPATAFVSMSAIHHLEPEEKRFIYQRCYQLLARGGVLLNGDEIRAENETTYLETIKTWAEHMRASMASGNIPPAFQPALLGWIDRNVTQFGQPKKSGDDIHETIVTQLSYLRSSGFTFTDCPWQTSLWAILRGIKSD